MERAVAAAFRDRIKLFAKPTFESIVHPCLFYPNLNVTSTCYPINHFSNHISRNSFETYCI